MTSCNNLTKGKFQYAFKQEYPYRLVNVLECEFILLEMMVIRYSIITRCYIHFEHTLADR